MKNKIYVFALMLLFATTATTTQVSAKEATTEQTQAHVAAISQRVDAIREMDFSSLNTTERKELKQELKGMKSELRSAEPVVIISVGALILIIILLIILL